MILNVIAPRRWTELAGRHLDTTPIDLAIAFGDFAIIGRTTVLIAAAVPPHGILNAVIAVMTKGRNGKGGHEGRPYR